MGWDGMRPFHWEGQLGGTLGKKKQYLDVVPCATVVQGFPFLRLLSQPANLETLDRHDGQRTPQLIPSSIPATQTQSMCSHRPLQEPIRTRQGPPKRDHLGEKKNRPPSKNVPPMTCVKNRHPMIASASLFFSQDTRAKNAHIKQM